MSGFGERFRRAGYQLPKPLIEVDGKPIIAHVVALFPGDHDFIFICNEDHLAEPQYRMAETLRRLAPNGTIVPIPAHKLGPVNAVLQAASAIDPEKPTIVNYCDFSCYWQFDDFERFVAETDCDGCVPAYRGFHPHSLGSTFYAYMREKGGWMLDIQEKQPFTTNPFDEYASSGTYYFRSGALCLDLLRDQMAQGLDVNGEFYVSLAYKVLAARGGRIAIYELQHFMQWGTPDDLEEYRGWSAAFRRFTQAEERAARHDGAILLPMAGLGKRFSDAGYDLPKPLIPVSGRPMIVQAMRDLPVAPIQKFVLRRDLPGAEAIERKLRQTFICAQFEVLEKVTEGQAITALIGTEGLDPAGALTIGACDNGILYDSAGLSRALAADDTDVLVWAVRGHPDGRRRPQMFGWIEADAEGRVTGVRVKQAPNDPATAPMIIGTFTFRRTDQFRAAVEALIARDGRVNGEFYIDSLIEDVLAAGLTARIFEVDHYLGWGTPTDLDTFRYWQSCFHKWTGHPYRLEKDWRIPSATLPALAADYAWQAPPRPTGVTARPVAEEDGGAPRSVAGNLFRAARAWLG
nr:NTP transferase domain-containing protein [Sphingomonas sp. MA1305]